MSKINLTLEVTERDRKLLKILGVIVILAVFFLCAFRPLVGAIISKQALLKTALSQKEQMEEEIAKCAENEACVEQLKTSIAEESRDFYKLSNNSQIDKHITKLVVSHGLKVSSLDIAIEPEYKLPVSYQELIMSGGTDGQAAGSSSGSTSSASSSTSSSTDSSASSSTSSSTDSSSADANGDATADANGDGVPDVSGNSGLAVSRVTVTVSGAESSFQSLIDELMHEKTSINVIGFSTDQNIYFSTSQEYKESSSFQIVLDYYMYDKSNLQTQTN